MPCAFPKFGKTRLFGKCQLQSSVGSKCRLIFAKIVQQVDKPNRLMKSIF